MVALSSWIILAQCTSTIHNAYISSKGINLSVTAAVSHSPCKKTGLFVNLCSKVGTFQNIKIDNKSGAKL